MGCRDGASLTRTVQQRCTNLHISNASIGYDLRKCFDRTYRQETQDGLWEEYRENRLPRLGYRLLRAFYNRTLAGVYLTAALGQNGAG